MSNLPVLSGLVLDLNATRASADTGASTQGQIASWVDVSPKRNWVIASQEHYWDDYAWKYPGLTPAGGPALHFTWQSVPFYVGRGSGTTASGVEYTQLFAAGGSAELFAVVRSTSERSPFEATAGDNPGFYQVGGSYGNEGNGQRPLYPAADGTIRDGSFAPWGTTYTFPAVTEQWHIYNLYHDGTRRVTAIDGVVVHTATVPFDGQGELHIGSAYPNDTSWSGDIAEFVAYDRALSGAERAQVTAYLTGTHLTAPVVVFDPPPGTGTNTGPVGLALASTLTDAFDGTVLDPAKWDTGNSWGADLDGQRLTLTGNLLTAGNYNVDSAFVHLTVPPVTGSDECLTTFLAQVAFGSPPTSWGINIHVSGTVSEITSNYVGDYGATQGSVTASYDPVAHAWLRLRNVFTPVDGGWLITLLCEAGPTPGQWTPLLQSPTMYSELSGQGYQIQLNNASAVPVSLTDFNVDPATSLLYMRMPDGTYRRAGVAGQPLDFTLPDGSVRQWPGSTYPLYQKQSDGSWLKVIG